MQYLILDYGKELKGEILQRFPEKDRKELPCPSSLELVRVNSVETPS